MVNVFSVALSLVYSGLFVVRTSVLPEFVFRDSEKIQAQIGGSETYAGTSFDAVAKIYSLFGEFTNVIVVAIGISFIWMIFSSASRIRELALGLVLLVPCAFFNLFVASKDTVVVLMSIIIVWSCRRLSQRNAALMVAACYLAFGAFVRSYFLLILGVAAFLLLVARARFVGKVALLATMCVGISMAPVEIYDALVGSRDRAVDYLLLSSPFGARTAFYNPVAPDSLWGFIVDYAYAVARLNFAALFSPGVKELFMQLFVFGVLWPVIRPIRGIRAAFSEKRILACLVAAHVIVSMLFEPDLGSYLRHLSSVALFSMALASRAEPEPVVGDGRRRHAHLAQVTHV